ncbi:MAG: hypothetical protein KAU21_17190, partial [Gammaproteobacteria bacterium]|nr:hypothetical protein [Gammaproteobacteria bacterium]
VAAEIFRNANLAGTTRDYVINVDEEMRLDPVLNGWSIRDNYKIISDKKYADKNTPMVFSDYLKNKVSLKHIDRKVSLTEKKSAGSTGIEQRLSSKTQNIQVKYHDEDKPYIKIETPDINVITGYIGKPVDVGSTRFLSKNNSDNFCAISVSSADGRPVNESNSMLIRTIGKGRNKNTKVVKTGNGYRLCVTGRNDQCIKPFFHPDAGEFVTGSCSLQLSVKSNHEKMVLESLNENGDIVNKRTAIRKGGKLSIILDDGVSHSLLHHLYLQ